MSRRPVHRSRPERENKDAARRRDNRLARRRPGRDRAAADVRVQDAARSGRRVPPLQRPLLRGDRGDGVPNVLSPSDTFVMDIKQKSVTKGILEKLLYENHTEWEDETQKNNFIRNQQMIDLSFIPTHIKQNIIKCYEETKPAPRKHLLDYMVQYKLRNLISVMDEF